MKRIKNYVQKYQTSRTIAKAVRQGKEIGTYEDGGYWVIVNS